MSHNYSLCCVLFPQDGVDGDSIFDSTDLDGRQSRAESLERAWDRICTNYQHQLDMEGLNDVVPQVD